MIHRNPFQLLAVETHWIAAEDVHYPHGQIDDSVIIFVRQAHEGPAAGNYHAQLFAQLTYEGLRLGFAGGHLATGELPAACHVLPKRALGYEHPSVAVKQCPRDNTYDG